MGVLGLWQLLKPAARQTKLEGLEGKTIAIDISIWLHQATKGVRNSANGHLLVLYNRICKLLYFKVKPVFVFDGPDVPNLKQRVLHERQRRRNAASNKSKALSDKIKKNLLEAYALRNAKGAAAQEEAKKLVREFQKSHSENIDDLFVLPDQPTTSAERPEVEVDDEQETAMETGDNLMYEENFDLTKIDPEVFESLPDEIQYELLTQYKEKLKNRKSATAVEFPEKSEDFSDFQMRLLLHKSEVSSKLANIKSSMKSTLSFGTDYDEIYHEKVAFEDDRELVLLTRKDSHTVFNLNKEDSETTFNLKDEEGQSEDEKPPESPKFKIEFSMHNKLELVPRNSEANETSLEQKKYIERDQEKEYVETESNHAAEEPLVEDVPEDSPVHISDSPKMPSQTNSTTASQPVVVAENPGIPPIEVIIEDRAPELEKIDETSEPKQSASEDSDDEDDFVEVEPVEQPQQSTTKKADQILIENLIEMNKEMIDLTAEEDLFELAVEQQDKSASNPTSSTSQASQAKTSTIKSIPQSNMSEPDLSEYSSLLAQETNALIRERNDAERLSHAVERHVIEDAKHLLRLFGLPYVQSPGEAEAQCAYLDHTDQTDGSCTEDSDVWLFGARRVYKNFFGQDPYIEYYSDELIKSQLGFDRETLIDIALMVGSDYTLGVEGIGVVKATEVLQEFEGVGIEKLKKFKEWYSNKDNKESKKTMSKVKQSLLKINLPDSFPSEIVFNAYINPNVDKSSEKFSWSLPDLDSIRKYMTKKMSWTIKKIDDDLLPIMRRINEPKIQKTIESYFTYETVSNTAKQSKRMKNAIQLFKSKSSSSSNIQDKELNLSEDELSNEQTSQVATTSKKKTVRRGGPRKKKSIDQNDSDIEVIEDNESDDDQDYRPGGSKLKKRKSEETGGKPTRGTRTKK